MSSICKSITILFRNLSYGREEKAFSCRGLIIAIDYFISLGNTDVKAVVPRFRQSRKNFNMPTKEPELLDFLIKSDQLVLSQTRLFDDETILSIAMRKNSLIVSNDRFKDWYKDATIKAFLKGGNK